MLSWILGLDFCVIVLCCVVVSVWFMGMVVWLYSYIILYYKITIYYCIIYNNIMYVWTTILFLIFLYI
jgi:hypothetical protein